MRPPQIVLWGFFCYSYKSSFVLRGVWKQRIPLITRLCVFAPFQLAHDVERLPFGLLGLAERRNISVGSSKKHQEVPLTPRCLSEHKTYLLVHNATLANTVAVAAAVLFSCEGQEERVKLVATSRWSSAATAAAAAEHPGVSGWVCHTNKALPCKMSSWLISTAWGHRHIGSLGGHEWMKRLQRQLAQLPSAAVTDYSKAETA